MEQTLNFFANLSSPQKLLWIISCLLIFSILEGEIPLFRFSRETYRKHLGVNLFFLFTTIVINLLFGLLAAGAFIWVLESGFGLLNWVELPMWIEVMIGIMLLDFVAQYVAHYLLHKIKFMWKFHMVHHSDTKVKASTGTRHHPGDFVIRETFALIAVLLGGLSFGIYMIYRILTIVFTYFIHANITLPKWLDKSISWVFISPNMHKFHHHFERPWTDTNFGNIFSFWDRIFGTMAYDDTSNIVYGLDVLDDKYSDDIKYQLKLPFDNSIKTDY